ncbi:hypothetical protein NYE40_23845 [Paenibacillus sp. FSL W8-1187]|uniref:hypothetical protein n=1 Tax=Paenibacillus sp. FSL W8-1187 TaxID=2975339 RepID=UPI0030DBF8E6
MHSGLGIHALQVFALEQIADRSNADVLFACLLLALDDQPEHRERLTVGQVAEPVPLGSGGICNPGSYHYAMIALFGGQKGRDFFSCTLHAHPERTVPAAGIRQALDNFRPLLRSASPEQQKKLFRSLIDRIIIPQDRDITKAVIQGTTALLNLEIPPMQIKGEKQA